MSKPPTEASHDSDPEGVRAGTAGDDRAPYRSRDPTVLQSIVESASDPAVVLDEQLRVAGWSTAAEDRLGWSADEILGREAPFVAADREQAFRDRVNRLEETRPTTSIETVCRTADGEQIDAGVSITRIEVGEGFAGYVGRFEDISRRESGKDRSAGDGTPMCVMQAIERLRPLSHAIAQAGSPAEIKRGVCEQLVTSDSYHFAWYADYNPVAERLTPEEWAGSEVDGLGTIDLTTDPEDTEQAIFSRAIQTSDTRALREISPDSSLEPTGSVPVEYRSVAAVPVVYEGTTYGVVALYSGAPDTFGPYEQGLLREIGELIGHGIHAVENRQLLHSETVVELTFRTRGPESIFVEVTEDLDCRLELEAFVPVTESAFLAYTSVDGADPATVVDRLADSAAIETARVINADGTGGAIEYRVNESPVAKLLEYGATVETAVMEAGEETVVGIVSPETDIYGIVAGLREAYSNTTLVSKRSVDRPPQTISVSQDPLDDVLTDRQRELIELAYHAGYFESPRHSSGDEIADSIGISSPTFYLHVRKATNNLLQWLDEQGLFD